VSRPLLAPARGRPEPLAAGRGTKLKLHQPAAQGTPGGGCKQLTKQGNQGSVFIFFTLAIYFSIT